MNGNNSDLAGPCSILPTVGVEGGDPLDEASCRRIFDAVGLRWREGDPLRLRRWLAPRLREGVVPSAGAYIELILSESPESRSEREALVRQFSTGETYFFRDAGLFARLGETILPDLLASRAGRRSLRIWSAGCASGEEVYSLAMLIDEMAPRLSGWEVHIVGTDIDGNAIERARTGIYGQWSFRGLDAGRAGRYFRKCPRGYQVIERLQAMVRFERADLLRDDPPDGGDFDLILCRNVLIYLSAPAVARVVGKLSAAVSDGGYLVPGHGELLGCVNPQLAARAFPEAVVYRKEHTVSTPQGSPVLPDSRTGTMVPAGDGRGRRPGVPSLARVRHPAAPAAGGLKSVPDTAPPDPDAVLAQAWRDADRGAVDAARAACNGMIAANPLDPRPYYLLAQLAQERGELEEARALLRKVLYLEPRFIIAQLELADLCERTGDEQGARRLREQGRRELERLPPDTMLPMPPRTTAGALLQALQGQRGVVNERRDSGHA